jgi:ATP-dependent Zn protease
MTDMMDLLHCAGMALGMVMQLPEEADETSISKRQLLAKLDVCMGGRVAEELIFGEGDVTTGASSDIEQVCHPSSPPLSHRSIQDL